MIMKARKKIVVIGGGTGVFTALTGLKKYDVDLTAVVNMADDGGSSGILREEFGMLPPGDIRRAIIALSRADNKILSELFSYRFHEGVGLTGHNFGNLMITALHRITGDFSSAIKEASKILQVEGNVIPVTLTNARLFAELENGSVIRGETNIDIPNHDGHLKIKRVWLTPQAALNPEARKAIMEANLVVIGPGDLYTSIMPNILVTGMKEALVKSKAKKAYAVNVMTKFGETNGYVAADFIQMVSGVLGEKCLDYVVVNNARPSLRELKKYAEEKSTIVDWNNLPPKPTPILGNFLRKKGLIRHDPDLLAKTLISLV